VKRLYEDAKRKNDRWQSRMFDPPISIELKASLGQVRKEERAKMKAKIVPSVIKPHLPRQPTSRHFQYDYMNSRQKRAVKKQLKKDKRQIKKQTKAIQKRLIDTKRDNQEEYSPNKKRQPPKHTKAKPLDVYSKGQFEQLHNTDLQHASYKRQQRDKALPATLFAQQKADRQVRMMTVKMELNKGMDDPRDYENAARAEAAARADSAQKDKDIQVISRNYSSSVLHSASRIPAGHHHDDLPQRINEMFEDGEKHNLRWPTRMFDPPIEIPLKSVLAQVEMEHKETIKAKKSPAPSPHHPRQKTSKHFDFAYVTTTEKNHFDKHEEVTHDELVVQQEFKQQRLQEIRIDHQEEFNVDKARAPPPEIRTPRNDELTIRQHEQWHNTELHKQTQERLTQEQRLEKAAFEQQRQNRGISAKQLAQRKTMRFEDKSAYEQARAAEMKLGNDSKASALQIDTLCAEEYDDNILKYKDVCPMSAKDAPPLRPDQAKRIEQMTGDEKRIADRWKNRMFDAPVDVPLNVVLKQVEDEHRAAVKKNAASGKPKAHLPRQPTQLHFEYDYINTAQQKREEGIADKIKVDTMDQQKQREQRMSMRKADQQAQYLPESPRSPPKSARAPPSDVYNRIQMDQIHKKEIHDQTAKSLGKNKKLLKRLEDLQGDERQKRVSMVVQQKTENFEDKSQFEQAKALQREKEQTILKRTVDIDQAVERQTAIVPTKPSEHADRLYADGQKHHDRWQTRMFDPPVEVELKEVLNQVESVHKEAVKRNAAGEKPQPHYPRQPGIGHLEFDFTTTPEMKKVKAKEEENRQTSKMQHDARLKRKTILRESNKAEYDVNKSRAPPATARQPPADAYSRKQEEQFKDEKVVEVHTGDFLAESQRLQVAFQGQETKRKTMRAAKTAEDAKQRQTLSQSLKKQKEKRATRVNKLIGADVQQRPMTAADSSYSTQVQQRPGVEMQYYDPHEDGGARPQTAPAQTMKVHDTEEKEEDEQQQEQEDDQYEEYGDDNDGFDDDNA